jgi:hypothetical protein
MFNIVIRRVPDFVSGVGTEHIMLQSMLMVIKLVCIRLDPHSERFKCSSRAWIKAI